MEMQNAQFLLYLITTIAVVVWLVGIDFLAKSAQFGRNSPDDFYHFDQSAKRNTILGSMEVAGDSAELAASAVSQIARNQTGDLGSLRILEAVDNQVTFQGVGNEQPGGFSSRRIQKGKLIFSAATAGLTRIDYAILINKSLRILLLIGGIFSVLGMIAICTGFALITIFVIESPIPSVRWQTLQMLQVIHFLWPPFLLGGLYRSQFSSIKNTLEIFLHNLPYAK